MQYSFAYTLFFYFWLSQFAFHNLRLKIKRFWRLIIKELRAISKSTLLLNENWDHPFLFSSISLNKSRKQESLKENVLWILFRLNHLKFAKENVQVRFSRKRRLESSSLYVCMWVFYFLPFKRSKSRLKLGTGIALPVFLFSKLIRCN